MREWMREVLENPSLEAYATGVLSGQTKNSAWIASGVLSCIDLKRFLQLQQSSIDGSLEAGQVN